MKKVEIPKVNPGGKVINPPHITEKKHDKKNPVRIL
jgi:hypothetical protein